MMPNPCGIISAPKAPWTIRPAMITAEAGGQAAGDRGEDEAGQAGQEDAAAAVPVAEASAGDQQDTQGERVTGAEPLDERLPAAEVGDDGGGGEVGDGPVEQVEGRGGDDDREHGPRPGGRLGGRADEHGVSG